MQSKWTLTCLLALLASAPFEGLRADFSDSQVALHPTYPGTRPFIIEITGTWPNDCHPGEQKPVVNSFDGQSVEIGFDIIVVHVTCNEVDTDYRVLVDMSGAVDETPPVDEILDVQVDYQGAMLSTTLPLRCPGGFECPELVGKAVLPERGLYTNAERANEGLLVARQSGTTVVYPLVYDEAGRGEWLIAVGPVIENSYFAELFRSSGGDCFDCNPSNPDTELSSAGQLSILVDAPGTMQVKVNDRPFSRYSKLVYGYRGAVPGPAGKPLTASLGGRWALSVNEGTDLPLGDITNFLPPAFDIVLQEATSVPGGPMEFDRVVYVVNTVTGEWLGQLVCNAKDTEGKPMEYCDYIDATDPAEPLFHFYQEGPSSLSIGYSRPVISIGVPPGSKAVRLD